MNELIILSSLGFIFGWLVGRANYKRQLIKCISEIQYAGTSNNEHFTAGMHRGIEAIKLYMQDIIKKNKIGKEYRMDLSSKKDLLSKTSKKNNKE